MITRRQFLVGATATVTASMLDRFHNYFERTDEPMLAAPKKQVHTLYVFPDRDLQLGLNGDPDVLPEERMNWLEFMEEQWGYSEPKKT